MGLILNQKYKCFLLDSKCPFNIQIQKYFLPSANFQSIVHCTSSWSQQYLFKYFLRSLYRDFILTTSGLTANRRILQSKLQYFVVIFLSVTATLTECPSSIKELITQVAGLHSSEKNSWSPQNVLKCLGLDGGLNNHSPIQLRDSDGGRVEVIWRRSECRAGEIL